ncbi:MAG: hypothetical protein KAJ52_04810 [Sedimentisphaerales bacterium]|nr:hypothetical protein [Sedimentisphaerales bacterium]
MGNSILPWMLLVPTVVGLVVFICPHRVRRLGQSLTLITAFWLLIAAVLLQSRYELRWQWQWLQVGSAMISVDLLVTGFGAVIALFTTVFGVLITLYSIGFTTEKVGKHNAYLLWTLAGATGAALANNLIFLLLCWEVVTLMLFLLINQGGQKARAGAAKTFAILGLSDCALLLGIALLLFAVSDPTLSMNQIQVTVDNPLAVVCFLFFAVAACAKAGAMPLHTWIPTAAEGAPTDVMAFLPASLDKLLGIYLLARVSLEFFIMTETLKVILMVIGAVTIIGAVMMAMIQHDLKKLLSFHAISQVGYMVLGIGTGSLIGVAGGIFHMINHAIYKSCLFLTAGSVEKQTGTTELDQLGGLARLMPFSFVACVISALAISGVPPMNGFTSKWMIYQATLAVPHKITPVLVAAAVFGSALTLASFVKVIHSVFLGVPSPTIAQKKPHESPAWMIGPMMALALLCVIFGVNATMPLRGFVAPALSTLGIDGLYESLQAGKVTAIDTLWNPVLATGLLLLALAVGVLIFYLGKGFQVRRTRTYIGGEKIEPGNFHYSGTNFYTTVRELWGIRQIYQAAEHYIFDLYHFVGRVGGILVESLRLIHTGVLSLYVSWVVIGLIIILIVLLGQGGSG